MRRFRFRLEAALKYRKTLEEMRQQAVAAVHAELDACDARIATCRAEMERTVALEAVGWDAELIRQKELYVDLLRIRIQRLAVERAQIAKRLRSAQEALIEAAKARKAIDRVREQHYAEYVREGLAEEQRALDEVGSRRSVQHL